MSRRATSFARSGWAIVWLAVLIGGAGCGATRCPPPWAHGSGHELLVRLERTTCFGWCPSYQVVVFRDGTVEYEGRQFVNIHGRATWRLEPAQLAALDQLLQSADYLGLDDAYKIIATDLPTIYTAYSPGGCTKSITHYGFAPRALLEVEDGIDRIVGIEQWIGSVEERKACSNGGC